jgi:hypothetical protein
MTARRLPRLNAVDPHDESAKTEGRYVTAAKRRVLWTSIESYSNNPTRKTLKNSSLAELSKIVNTEIKATLNTMSDRTQTPPSFDHSYNTYC